MNNKLPSYSVVFQILAVVCIAILLAALWKQRNDLAQMKRDYGRLQNERGQLQQGLTPARAEAGRLDTVPAPGRTEAPTVGVTGMQKALQEGAVSQERGQTSTPSPEAVAIQLKAHPAEPAPNRLTLAGTEVHPATGGLEATLRFSPSETGPLGLVAVAIRLPKNVEARILDLAPVGTAMYVDDSKEISEDGRFAFFQGTLGEVTDVQFVLSVSGPATAEVRGTRGIGAFQLDIQSTGATVRGK